jgi:CheY-like chemotaxis protein
MTRTSMNQPATILVVDDSEVVLAVTKTVLEAAGYRVLTHSGPAGCVAVILQEKPNLVLIDVNMPRLGGETIVKLFGKAQPNSEAIILLFSTLSADQLEDRAQASGAHGYIRKTDDTFELVRQVNRWLRPKEMGTSGVMHAVEPRPLTGGPFGTPRRRSAPSVPPPERRVSRPPPRTSGTSRLLPVVLFMDDDMESLSTYRREVQGEAYRADFALSATQALRHIESSTPPYLIVAGLEPFGIDAYERAVASDGAWAQRFIFVVGQGRSERASEFLETFKGTVLRRPVTGDALRQALRRQAAPGAEARKTHGG